MGLKVLLIPCIYVYRFFKYVFLGFRYLPLILTSIFSHFILTIQIIIGTLATSAKPKNSKVEVLKVSNSKNTANENKTIYQEKEKKQKFKTEGKVETLGLDVLTFPQKVARWWNNLPFIKNLNKKKSAIRTEMVIDYNSDDAKKTKEKQTYKYEIKTPAGKLVTGYFDAFSKAEVFSFLKSEGNTVYSITTSKFIQLTHGNSGGSRTKIKNKDLVFMLAQLSTYIKAGIPLVDSVKILAKQFKNPNYQKILRAVVYDLSTGQPFSEALSRQGEAFPKLLINMIATSEMTGELPETLDDMEQYYTETEETRKAMVSAMMYPTIIFIIAIGVGTFIMLFVVPKFVEIYDSMENAEIPGITKFVLWLSDFLSNYIILIALAVVALILLFRYLYKNVKSFRNGAQWLGMHIPVMGNVIIYNEVTMFTKTFSSLLAHNVFITDSMDILNRVTNNEIYKTMIADAITSVAKGDKISTAFKDQWCFPVPAYEMIVTGEKTGQLSEMMYKVSTYYQDLHKNAVSRIKSFVEPLMIIMLTVMVGVIVLAIVVPMFNMYSAIQQ